MTPLPQGIGAGRSYGTCRPVMVLMDYRLFHGSDDLFILTFSTTTTAASFKDADVHVGEIAPDENS